MISRLHVPLLLLVVAILHGCSSLPLGVDYPKTTSSALIHPEDTWLGQHFATAVREHPGHSGFRIIRVGEDGFLLRQQMIRAAQRTLDLQYYIFRADKTGRLLTDAALQAADRGVRVRILIDDAETEPGDEQLTALAAHRSIELRIFNPFAYRGHVELFRAIEFLFSAHRLDYRMHNKLLVVDNTIALIGGRNIADPFFQIDPKSQFADEDVFAVGPVAEQLSSTFDAYWNSPLSIPAQALAEDATPHATLHQQREALQAQAQKLRTNDPDYAKRLDGEEPLTGMLTGRIPLTWAPAEVVCDSPEKKKVVRGAMLGSLLQRAVADAAGAVHSELLLVTPYLIPGKDGMKLLDGLRRRQIRVRVLTNSMESSTVPLAQAGYMHYRASLVDHGVELHEVRSRPGNAQGSGQSAALSRYGNYSLHAKLFVFDRQRVFIGSMNFDQRSMHLNTEVGLIIDSPALAQQVASRFEAMTQPANAYRLAIRPATAGGSATLLWQTREDGRPVEYLTEPARSDWQRFKLEFLSLLPIDDEL